MDELIGTTTSSCGPISNPERVLLDEPCGSEAKQSICPGFEVGVTSVCVRVHMCVGVSVCMDVIQGVSVFEFMCVSE